MADITITLAGIQAVLNSELPPDRKFINIEAIIFEHGDTVHGY